MEARKLIVCLTGMPGAGKSTVAAALQEKGFLKLTMGDIIREEASRQEMEPTDKNLGLLMLKVRQEMGPAAVAKLMLKKIYTINTSTDIVIDGIRSIAEVEVLRTLGNVRVLAIHASTNTRYYFLTKRDRGDAPSDFFDFESRDKREMNIGISDAIALADESISNNNINVDELKSKAIEIIDQWKYDLNKKSIL